MDVILKKDVANLGTRNDLVNVKDGYARNFLIPQGYAVVASPSAKRMREETLKQRAHKEEKILEEAQGIADKLAKVKVKIGAKVGEKGKIFGSVNTVQLAEALQKEGFDIDRKSIAIKQEPIKEIGTYEAEILLHKDVTQTVNFEVAEE